MRRSTREPPTAAWALLVLLAAACGTPEDAPPDEEPAARTTPPPEAGDAARPAPSAGTTSVAPPPLPPPGGPDALFPPLDDAGEGSLVARRMDGPASPGQVSEYWLYLPPGYDEARSWPLLLYLHGRSLRGSDLERVKRYGIPQLLDRGLDLPFVVVAPQLPDGQRWTDMERLGELVEDVAAAHAVDPDRVYVTGYSMGAGGAWRFVAAHPDVVAAAVPIAATTPRPTEAMLDALERVPLRVYHGTADEAASFDDAVRMVRALEERGAPVEMVSLEGADHNIVTAVYSDAALYHWLLGHRRGLTVVGPGSYVY